MQKHWDNPLEHAMPEGSASSRRGGDRRSARGSGDGAGAHGRSDGHGIPPIHPQRQSFYGTDAAEGARVKRDLARPSGRGVSNQQSGCGLIMTEFTSADGLVADA